MEQFEQFLIDNNFIKIDNSVYRTVLRNNDLIVILDRKNNLAKREGFGHSNVKYDTDFLNIGEMQRQLSNVLEESKRLT